MKMSGVHVNGSYHRFISLNDSNSVDVDAVVLEKGPYYISTDTVNGMYFQRIWSSNGYWQLHFSHGWKWPTRKKREHSFYTALT
jgi:hypothetical protein